MVSQKAFLKCVALFLVLAFFANAGAQGNGFGKLRGGLTENDLLGNEAKIFLFEPSLLQDVPAVLETLGGLEATSRFKKYGHVIIAKLPAKNVLVLLESDSVKAIWPDLEVFSTDEQALEQVNAHVAWDLGYFGDGIKIAVLDTGIDASHPVFQDRVVLAQNFSQSPTTTDVLGHGTHVAGIAAAQGEVNGVAPHALLMNGKVLDDTGYGTFSSVIDGINWAVENGAHVINLSLGAASHDTQSPLNMAVRDAMDANVVVSVASGNCGQECPSSFCAGFVGVTLPGNTDKALTVGAVDRENNHACFSSGEVIEGIGIKPDLVAPGVDILSSLPGGGQGTKSGTSMATPFVSGAAALVLEAHSGFSSYDVKNLLQNTSLDLGEAGKDVLFGQGLLDLSNIESGDTNGDNGGDNGGNQGPPGDPTGQGDPYNFYGPTELIKNEFGEYEIEFVGGGLLEAGEIAVQEIILKDTTVEFIVLDEFGTIVDYNVVGPFEIDDINQFSFPTTFSPLRVGNFTVQANIYQEGEVLPGGQSAQGGEIYVATAEKNVSVFLPPDLIEIEEFSAPASIQKGETLSLEVLAENTGSFDVNAFLEVVFVNDQNSIAEVFSSQTMEVMAGEQTVFEVEKQVFIPSGDYNVISTVFFEGQKISQSAQSTVKISDSPIINSFVIPQSVDADSNSTFSVTLENTGLVQIQPAVTVYLLDGNDLVKTFFDSQAVIAPLETKTIGFEWLVKEPAKDYLLKAEVLTENYLETAEQAVEIIDLAPPVIEEIVFPETVWQNTVLEVRARASDYSKIESLTLIDYDEVEWYDMKKVSGTDSNAEFVAAALELSVLDAREFQVTACDEFGNCSEEFFYLTVEELPQECNGKVSLIVKDNDAVSVFPFYKEQWSLGREQFPGCSAEWKTKEFGAPSIDFLKQFGTVFWSNSNYFSNSLDSNEISLLKEFVEDDGRLFVEGSDVSSEHGFDDLALEVLKAEFSLEIGQDENFLAGEVPQGIPENWWSEDWNYALPINYSGEHSAVSLESIFEFFLDTAPLVSSGKLQPDCDDLRIVSNYAGVPTEIEREVQNCNSQFTRVRHRSNFEVPADVDILATDSNGYFVYYGNPLAENPSFDLREDFLSYSENDSANKLTVLESEAFTTSPVTKSETAWIFRQIPVSGDLNIEFGIRGTNYGECNNAFEVCFSDIADTGITYLDSKLCAGLISNGCSANGLVPILQSNSERICSGGCQGNGTGNTVSMNTNYYARLSRGTDGFSKYELFSEPERTIPFTGMPLVSSNPNDFNVLYAWNHQYIGEYADPIGGSVFDAYFGLLYRQPAAVFGEELFLEDFVDTNSGNDLNATREKIVFFYTAPQEFLLETADINYDFAPYADAVKPLTGTIPIAGWDENHVAISGWYETCTGSAKMLFSSVSLSAFSEQDQNAILEGALNWLLFGTSPACGPPGGGNNKVVKWLPPYGQR